MRLIGLAVVLAVGLTLAPIVAESQRAGKVYRIGCLLLPPLAERPSVERQAFLQGLRDFGYDEGRNITIEYQSAAWNRELLPDLAADLVARKVDIILAAGPQATRAAQEATKTIPIVMIVEVDPIESGLVPSLRPTSNITGFSANLAGLGGKRLELLREAVPQLANVAVIWNPGNPAATSEWKEIQAAARNMGIKLESVEVRGADDFVAALRPALAAAAVGGRHDRGHPDLRLPLDSRRVHGDEPRARDHGGTCLPRKWRAHELRCEDVGSVSPRGWPGRQNPQGRQAG